jgi:lipopolysaccharide export system protein LptA
MKRVWLLVPILLTVLTALPAYAADDTEQKVHITADHFLIEESSNLATFSGNVVVIQGDTTVHSNVVKVHYGAGGASDIETLEAVGNVVIDTPKQHVTGESATYDPKAKVMIVIGNVVSVSKTGRVTGSKLRVDFKANTTEFQTENGGRVKGVFNP